MNMKKELHVPTIPMQLRRSRLTFRKDRKLDDDSKCLDWLDSSSKLKSDSTQLMQIIKLSGNITYAL